MPNFGAENSILPHQSPTLPRVLLVDDDESVRDTLSMVLEHSGFEVSSAPNVNQALALIGSQSFDALVTDLHMPQPGDGLTVVSAMRHSNPSWDWIVSWKTRYRTDARRLPGRRWP